MEIKIARVYGKRSAHPKFFSGWGVKEREFDWGGSSGS